MTPRKIVPAALLAVLGVGLLCMGSDAPTGKPKKTPWKITGQLEEACSCSSACPCWFNSKPTRMMCSGGQFLFIEKGSYGKVPLNGLAIGSMAQSPEGKGMMESFGSWNFNYLYIDEKANPEQRQALKALALEVLAGDASPKKEFRVVPIARKIDGKEHRITLGTYGSFSGHLVEGGLGGSVKIVNPPGADPIHKEYSQGNTSSLTYTDAGETWDFQNSNYMFATFEVDSAQYEKHAAMMTQKMGKK